MSKQYHAEGFTGPTGTRWVHISDGSTSTWVRLHQFTGHGKEAIAQLARQGIFVIGPQAHRAVMDQVASITDFPYRPLIEEVGWNGPHFAMPDGTVFSPEGNAVENALSDHVSNRCSERGSLARWRRTVAEPLSEQPILVFVICLTFVAPLLRLTNRVGNFGFELVGGKGTGKSTAQQLAASVLGGATQGDDGHYWISFDATLNALEQAMASHSDSAMIFEEANLFMAGQNARSRGSMFQAFAFRLGGGSEKARFDGGPIREFRFVFLTSSNEPLASLIGTESDAAKAAADRLMTLPISASRPHGVFDSIPAPFESGSSFAAHLIEAANENHGNAIRRFLQRLVTERAKSESDLKGKINAWMQEFRSKAEVDLNDGSAVRVADAFGLVYAAGKLAQSYRALPRSFYPGRAALSCYRLHLSRHEIPIGFDEELLEVSRRPEIVALNDRGPGPLDEAQRLEALGFVGEHNKVRELWFTKEKIREAFPNWDRIKSKPSVLSRLQREGTHKQAKRPIGPKGSQIRVYCFTFPDG